MAQPVVHFELSVKNGDKSMEFYKKVFDWEADEVPGMQYHLVKPATKEGSVGGGIFSAPAGTSTYVTFYIMVDDIQTYLTKAEKMGGKTVQPPSPIPGIGFSGMFHDPDGLLIGLFQPLNK